MTIAKNMASVSRLAPVAGPFTEGGANLSYNALELLKVHPYRVSSSYSQSLTLFHSMEKLSKEISLLITDSESKCLKTYFRADQLREAIAGYQTEIQRLRDNLMFYCTLSASVRLFETDRKSTSSSDEDFPELKEFRQMIQSDIYLKEEIRVGCRPNTRSTLFKEYHMTTSFNGKEYLTTTRSYEGEPGQESLKAELKLLARIRPEAPRLLEINGTGQDHIWAMKYRLFDPVVSAREQA
ncbi:hypothetical protein M422DRAFT_255438 [Sphaerobolus stellatus SS14]|uniref:Unplaced genomic scaffold SPHSTscaffold_61, whole genome shotgun sequence n=1 Tax=Sphaerobolus stellatus (strain SS14) TaxID=990650 RepID=A0A0C9VST9_SPHS4|nr:hypothetical protein M422DRAFT_255438 [Sphaerobolus stellatus SS14]